MLPHVKTIRLNLPGDYVPKSAMQTLAALKLWTARPDASFQVSLNTKQPLRAASAAWASMSAISIARPRVMLLFNQYTSTPPLLLPVT